MKSIAIVTENWNDSLGEFLRRNLLAVFGGYAEIESYYLDRFPAGDVIRQDVVLVMTTEMGVNVRDRTSDAKKILPVNRTIGKGEIYKIFSIPPGTRVLVVNDKNETTMEMVSLLMHLGIDHLDLVPYDPARDYYGIKIAITPGERFFVPTYIDTIIDTGHRYIDISTFILLMDMLKITDHEVGTRLHDYADTIIPLESGINNQYRQLYMKNLELDSVLNLTHEGILLLDNEGTVLLHSKALRLMLDLKTEIVGRKLSDHVGKPLHEALGQAPFSDELVQYKGKSFLVTGRRIEQYGERSGTFFNFRDVTYVRSLEHNLDARQQASGFVPKYTFGDLVTDSPAMRACIDLARKFAGSDLPVLVSGESGTGKELMAHSIHSASARAGRPFVAFNCAAMPESLIESELFGYESGSFTGALKGGKPGLFEQADNGTIFLDEIGDMPFPLQSRLLRVLQERQVMRVGSRQIIDVDIRIIAATNQDLEGRIRKGLFREDLFYRLNVLPLPIPPLRERARDIMLLLRSFLESGGNGDLGVSPETETLLARYSWPGNIRELWNVAAYSSFMAGGEITVGDLPAYIRQRILDFGKEYGELAAACPGAEAMEVLEALHDSAAAGRGVGRKRLSDALSRRCADLSEGRIRRVLEVLCDMDLVRSRTGRGGSMITEKGKMFINWYRNRLSRQPE